VAAIAMPGSPARRSSPRLFTIDRYAGSFLGNGFRSTRFRDAIEQPHLTTVTIDSTPAGIPPPMTELSRHASCWT